MEKKKNNIVWSAFQAKNEKNEEDFVKNTNTLAMCLAKEKTRTVQWYRAHTKYKHTHTWLEFVLISRLLCRVVVVVDVSRVN